MEIYRRRCNIIYNIARSKYPDLEMSMEFHELLGTAVISILNVGKKCDISISQTTTTWAHLELGIETKIMSDWVGKDCAICFESYTKNVSCPECRNSYCAECYIRLFRNGHGIMVCPFCRSAAGVETPAHRIEGCVREMRNKLANRNYIYVNVNR